MKTRPRDLMRDPFFAQLMFVIEKLICAADREARKQGVTLKDSQIQSALTKARGFASGKTPRLEEATDAERILKELVWGLRHAPERLMVQSVDRGESAREEPAREEPVQAADWILAIEAVVDSVKTRRSDVPGSREYLEFVKEFVARAEAR